MLQRKHIKKQTVKSYHWFWWCCHFENKTEINYVLVTIGVFKPICLTSSFLLLLYIIEHFGYTLMSLYRSSCDVLSLFGQASQSGKWLGKASCFISQLVEFCLFWLLGCWQPGLQLHVFCFVWHSNPETQHVSESSSLCLHTPASLVLCTLNRIVWKCFSSSFQPLWFWHMTGRQRL